MNPSSINDYLSEYQKTVSDKSGSPAVWINTIRQEAIEQFIKSGFPTKRDEEWKYTDLTELKQQQFFLPGDTDPNQFEGVISPYMQWGLDKVHSLVFLNGNYLEELSSSNLS